MKEANISMNLELRVGGVHLFFHLISFCSDTKAAPQNPEGNSSFAAPTPEFRNNAQSLLMDHIEASAQ